MSARRTLVHLAAKAGMLLAAISVVTILLAAVPGHHAPAQTPVAEQASSDQNAAQQSAATSTDASDEKASEKDAVESMSGGHHDAHSLHMHMTQMRQETPQDAQKAQQVVIKLRASIDKYKDYHVALNDGFKIFAPNVPQKEYHFTNHLNGFLEAFTFDAARPTSLLYKKTATGYELVGAMYTMPRNASEDQLNERIPLSVAMWHQHTNLCFPRLGHLRDADWTKFGLQGSIATEDACEAAGGRFHPVVLGWMTHVYPYEDSTDKIFAMHMD
jgi:hypothetical protein